MRFEKLGEAGGSVDIREAIRQKSPMVYNLIIGIIAGSSPEIQIQVNYKPDAEKMWDGQYDATLRQELKRLATTTPLNATAICDIARKVFVRRLTMRAWAVIDIAVDSFFKENDLDKEDDHYWVYHNLGYRLSRTKDPKSDLVMMDAPSIVQIERHITDMREDADEDVLDIDIRLLRRFAAHFAHTCKAILQTPTLPSRKINHEVIESILDDLVPEDTTDQTYDDDDVAYKAGDYRWKI